MIKTLQVGRWMATSITNYESWSTNLEWIQGDFIKKDALISQNGYVKKRNPLTICLSWKRFMEQITLCQICAIQLNLSPHSPSSSNIYVYKIFKKKKKKRKIQQIQLLQLQNALKGTETIKEYIYIYFGIVKYWAIHLFIKCDNNY